MTLHSYSYYINYAILYALNMTSTQSFNPIRLTRYNFEKCYRELPINNFLKLFFENDEIVKEISNEKVILAVIVTKCNDIINILHDILLHDAPTEIINDWNDSSFDTDKQKQLKVTKYISDTFKDDERLNYLKQLTKYMLRLHKMYTNN